MNETRLRNAVQKAALATLISLAIAIAPARAFGLSSSSVLKIDHLVEAFMGKNRVPGLSIAVMEDGRLAWSKGYGLSDVENKIPAIPETVYRSASMGKMMTAIAAMRLVERGKLDLDDDIRKTCPAYPAMPWKITARNLLQHTSGIRHYGGPRDEEEQNSTIHYPNVAAALAPFKDDSLTFEPGTAYLYSTYGFGVLGCVIEGASGTPFLEYMKESVWAPAGMQATRDDDPAAIVPHRAEGYALRDGELRRARFADMSNRLPAGGYLTTVGDLMKFAQAVLDGILVQPNTFALMTTPTKLPNGQTVSYGLGWGVEVDPWMGDSYLFHGGSSPGASGLFVMMPKHRFAMVFQTNLEDIPPGARSELAEDVTRVVLGFPERKE